MNPYKTDCISREVVKEMLIEEWTKYNIPMELDINLSFVLEKISALPSVTPKTNWIPVSERLPKEPGNYLVTMKGPGDKSFVIENWYDGEGYNEYMDDFWRNSSNIIAWMPLPEPYKKEGDNNDNV